MKENTAAVVRQLVRRFLLAVLVAVVAAACSKKEGDPPAEQPSDETAVQLRIDPGAAIILGDTPVTLSVIATDADGEEFTPASVSWTSSSEDVEVGTEGVATARAETASAWVTANVGDVTSEPVLVVAAVAGDGVIPLEDARFVSEPEMTSGQIASMEELRLEAVLSGAAPDVDDLVLATGSTAFAGRVIEVKPEGENNLVTVQGVGLETLFKELSINVERSWADTGASGAEANPSALTVGAFECKTEADAELGDLNVVLNPTLDTAQLVDSFIVLIDDDGLSDFEVITSGPFTLDVDGSIELPLELTAKISCTTELGNARVMPQTGAFSLINIEAYADFGVAFEVAANTVSARLLAKGSIEGIVRTGVDYDAVSDEIIFLRDGEFEDNIDLSFDNVNELMDESQVTIKPAMSLTLGTRFVAGKGNLEFKWDFGAWTGKSTTTMSFATIHRQIADPSFAASLSREVTAAFTIRTSGIALASTWLVGLAPIVTVAAYFFEDVTLPSITLSESKSPTGTLSAPGLLAVGDTGDFVVELQDVGESSYDVREVQIIKHSGIGSELTTQVAATLVPEVDGQTQFTWQWTPTQPDVGDHRFAAFVVTNTSPVTPFEIGDDSSQTVTVGGSSGVILRSIQGAWDVDCTAVIRDPMSQSDQDHNQVITAETPISDSEVLTEDCAASLTSGAATVSGMMDGSYEAQTIVNGDVVSSFRFHADGSASESVSGWVASSPDHFVNASPRSDGAAVIYFEVLEPTPFMLTFSVEGTNGDDAWPVGGLYLSCGALQLNLTEATTMSDVLPVAQNCSIAAHFDFYDRLLPQEDYTSSDTWSTDMSVVFQ